MGEEIRVENTRKITEGETARLLNEAIDRLYREYDEPTQEIPVIHHYIPLRVEVGGNVIYGQE